MPTQNIRRIITNSLPKFLFCHTTCHIDRQQNDIMELLYAFLFVIKK